jgi:hypothetical protein
MTEDRAAEVRAWAEANGFQYEAVVPDELLALPFYLFTLGQDETVVTGENLLSGEWQGMPVDVFDVSVPTESGFQALGFTNYWTENELITTAMAGTGADLPYVYVEKKGFLTRVADDMDAIDRLHHDHLEAECGAKDFDHHFEVKTQAPDFAAELFDHALMEAMLTHGTGYVYEVAGGQFIVHTPKTTEQLPALLDATKAFWDNIPSAVVEKYPAAAVDG